MVWPIKIIRISLLLVTIAIPLVFLPNTSELFEFNKMIITYFLSATVAGGWALDWLLTGKLRFRRTLLDVPLVIFLISQMVSMFFSMDPRTSWLGYYSRFNGGLVSLFCYSLLYWAFVTFADARFTRTFLRLSLYTATLVAFYGILEHFGIDAKWWVQDVKNRVFSTLGQPNWLAAYLIALIFVPLSQSVKTLGKSHKYDWISVTMVVLLFITLLYTKSRSGLLGLAIGSAVYMLSLFKQPFSKSRLILVSSLFVSFALLAVIIPNPVRDMVIKPVTQEVISGPALETGGTESGSIRKIVWTGAIRIWLNSTRSFLIGTGPETFAMAYYQQRPLEHNYTSEWELLYNKAHNEFLNYLATTGILGLLSYLILLGSVLYMFISLYRTYPTSIPKNPSVKNNSDANHTDFAVLAALFSGWLTISVTNFWGFSVVAVQLLLFLLPAVTLVLAHNWSVEIRPATNWTHLHNIAVMGILCVYGFATFSVARYWIADMNYAAGQKNLRAFTMTQDPAYIVTSYDHYSTAMSLNNLDAPISSDFSVVSAYMSLLVEGQDATTATELNQLARVASDRSVRLSPFHPNYWKTRSRMFLILASTNPSYYPEADNALVIAQQISPTDPRLPYSRGVIAQYVNDQLAAKNMFTAALKLKADFPDPRVRLAEIATQSAQPAP